MLLYETGNIVTDDYPVFCHQVNCRGVMGAGLAKQIRDKYSEVYKEYYGACNAHDNLLGAVLFTDTLDHRICCNMFAQDGYGRHGRYTDYAAFKTCLRQIKEYINDRDIEDDCPIAFPYGIGCGLAGGDWNIIQGMLKDFSKTIKQDVIVVSLQ